MLLLAEIHRIEWLMVVGIVAVTDIVVCYIIGIITNQIAISRLCQINVIIIIFVFVVGVVIIVKFIKDI